MVLCNDVWWWVGLMCIVLFCHIMCGIAFRCGIPCCGMVWCVVVWCVGLYYVELHC